MGNLNKYNSNIRDNPYTIYLNYLYTFNYFKK